MSDPGPAAALVIGLGNPLMGDDGLGLVALERLRCCWRLPPTVELVDGGTWGVNLLHPIESAHHVLLLDAVRAGGEPGSLVELSRDDLPRMFGLKLSPHQIDLREVLALADLRGTLPQSLLCLGLEPDSIELREGLSRVVAARVDDLVTAAVARLRAWGHRARPRVAPAYA